MNKYSLSALVAAGLLAGAATSASAADLGGNCCADLEERIAELEATTARKGNRKVSLTVSGWVNQQITFWDDGVESNVYIHDLGSTLGSHVKFTGQAHDLARLVGWLRSAHRSHRLRWSDDQRRTTTTVLASTR